MIIKTLMEDTSTNLNCKSEHGFSLYIETQNHKILFDTGASDLFLKNAEVLGVDIEAIDIAFISHGHYDHGGGLGTFLRKNSKAKVYIHHKAFDKHYSQRLNGNIEDIGINPSIRDNKRIVFTKEDLIIDDELELFAGVTGREFFSSCNNTLFMESRDGLVNDTFEHEQNLIINENGILILIAGCAHNGIINILNHFKELKGTLPKYVFGGFHLFNYGANKSEAPDMVSAIGEFLSKTETRYYTGHCTGLEAFTKLKGTMKDQVQYLAAGNVVEI
jgi:7,8-dihydropterin-6-yl-methyl-4-(beta-D-ribofuranosyl)aminobenzene 5'-phosphate synthase